MRELNITYDIWKQIVQNNNFPCYHENDGYYSLSICTGNKDYIYHSHVNIDSYGDWLSNFGNDSILLTCFDDAIALIVGLSNIPETPNVAPVILEGTPQESDGRLNIVNAPMTHGMSSWWTGRGDELNPTDGSSGRGKGTALDFEFDGYGDETITLDFSSYVEVYDGEGIWHPPENWSILDRYWVGVYIRSNQDITTVNNNNTGNCNVVDTGQGFSIVVPAAGDGTYDIDLAKARPVPQSGSPAAYWYVGKYYEEELPIPSVDGSGNPTGNHILFYDLPFTVWFCNDMPMGSPTGKFEVDSDKSEPIHKNWQMRVRCKRVSTSAGKFAVWLKFFRPNTADPDLG